jgi:putative hydrolase of the HAD superfamily
VLGDGDPVEDLLDEVFATERAALTGQGDFREDLQAVLRRAGVGVPVDEVLRLWSRIEPVPGMLDLVAELRAREYPCFVASNQQRYRARHMSTVLGYGRAFTGEFYSCALGATKPDPAFFRAILRELDLEPEGLLFVDDHEPNVDAARTLGVRAVRFDARHHDAPAAALRWAIEEQLQLTGK